MLSETNIISKNIEKVESDITVDITLFAGKYIVSLTDNCTGDQELSICENKVEMLKKIEKALV